MTTPARDFPGHVQAGGEASGAPWAEATFMKIDDEVAILVNETEVARLTSPTVTDTGTNDVFLIEGADEPLFFRPRDPDAFRAAVLPPTTTAEKIAAATAATAAAADETMVMDTVPEPGPAVEGDAFEPEADDQPTTPAWVWWVLAGVGALLLILLVSFCGDDGEVATSSTTTSTILGSTTTAPVTTSTAPASTTTAPIATTTTAAATTSTAPATTTTAPATTTSSLPPPAFGAGTHVVGEDVDPGVYETGIVTELLGCEWQRLSGTSGDPDEVLASGQVANHDVVEILADDAAFDTNCDAWYELSGIDRPMTTIPEGKWVVNTHIEFGTFSAPGGNDCAWARLSGLTGTEEDVIASETPTGPTSVTIEPSDVAFTSADCGEWTPS
jgi:hypothetical protein